MANISKLIHGIALSQVGVFEWAGADNNPKVVEYYAAAGHPEIKQDSVPWCAAFNGWVLVQCGLIPSGSLLARSYTDWGEGVELKKARAGDIVVLPRGKPWQGHTGIVDRIEGGKIYLISGNQNDQVTIKGYPIDNIVAIRRAKEPHASLADSKQVKISITQIASGVGSVGAGLAMLDDQAQTIAVVGGIALIAFGIWFFRERLQKFAAGIR